MLACCNLEKGLAHWHLHHARHLEAVEHANSACEIALKNQLPNYHSFAALPLALLVRRRYLESLAPDSPDYRRGLIRAKRLARKAVWICRFYPTDYPFALRELGEFCRLRGQTSRALRYYDKSLRIAEDHSARYEIAKTRLAKAKLLVELQASDADVELGAAQSQFDEFSRMIDEAVASLANPLGENSSVHASAGMDGR